MAQYFRQPNMSPLQGAHGTKSVLTPVPIIRPLIAAIANEEEPAVAEA